MNIQPTRVKPNAAATSKRLRLGDLSQSKMSTVERPGDVFAASWHTDIDV